MKRRDKAKEKDVAKQRIKTLFEQAALRWKEDVGLANRYVTLARKIAMKYKVRIPPTLKRRFCKHCYAYFVPGFTCRVRTKEGKVVYTCFSCKKFTKIPYVREQKAKRKIVK